MSPKFKIVSIKKIVEGVKDEAEVIKKVEIAEVNIEKKKIEVRIEIENLKIIKTNKAIKIGI